VVLNFFQPAERKVFTALVEMIKDWAQLEGVDAFYGWHNFGPLYLNGTIALPDEL